MDSSTQPTRRAPGTEASPDPLIGRTLGGFFLLERLGQGGGGTVYRAEQTLLGREAVVKVLRSELQSDGEALQRFLREARLASKLDHPYAAHVYAFGAEPEGLLWIAMELVRGRSLEAQIRAQGPLPLNRFVPLFERICEVIHTAHEQGIVHRDIKPGNVMVISRAGKMLPKLLDLGVAKLRDAALMPAAGASAVGAPSNEIAETPSGLFDSTPNAFLNTTVGGVKDLGDAERLSVTRDDQFVGTPHYMAPEQWLHSAEVDRRADIYALAVMSYVALTGRPVFSARNVRSMAVAHARTPPPPLPPEFPEALTAVLRRGLAKKPSDRPETALELARLVRAASGLEDEPQDVPQLDPATREEALNQAPQPIAEAVAALEAARTARAALAAVREVGRTLAHYLGMVALVCRSRTGGGGAPEDGTLSELGQKLFREGLSWEEWLSLGERCCRPFAQAPLEHPLPELPPLLCDRTDAGAASGALATLLSALLAEGTSAPDEAEARAALPAKLEALAGVLGRTAFLNEYALCRIRGDAAERWMGCRRPTRPSRTVTAMGLMEGEIILMDPAGLPVLRLNPVAQALAPTPGAPEELFIFDGPGRHGARLIARPLGFERQDESVWTWLGKVFPGVSAAQTHSGDPERPPFRGLASFSSDDASDFFGREREAEAFANRLRMQPLLAVVGPSGVGKSSFVQAGAIPLLSQEWRPVVVRPGPTPVATLVARLSALGVEIPGGADALLQKPALLGRTLRTQMALRQERWVLVVDQFEELLTLCLDAKEREAYAEALVQLCGTPADPLRVVLTLRDDFLIRAQAVGPLKERIGQGLQLLGTPAPEDLLRILTEPLRRVGYAFEDLDLPRQMVRDVAEQSGALALLSFTATKLWEMRDGHFRRLTRKAYQQLGGVGGALAHHAEGLLAQMSEDERKLVREAFRHLVAASGTRAVLTRSELMEVLGTSEAKTRVLELLIQARILVASEGDGGEDRIEIIHEALLSSWPRLVAWQRENAENARMRDQLRAAARQWNEKGRPRGVLWRDESLVEYRLWRSRYPGALTSVEQAFAEASLNADARGRRIRRGLLLGSFVALVVGLAVLARAHNKAEAAATQARQRLAELREEQGRLSYLGGRPLHALVYLSRAHEEGVRGAGIDYLLARTVALASAQQASFEHGASVLRASVSPDGRRVATASRDGVVRVWSLETSKQMLTMTGHEGIIRSAQFSPDGRHIASAGADSVIRLWDAQSGAQVAKLAGHEGPVADVVWRPDGRALATAAINGDLKIWDVADGQTSLRWGIDIPVGLSGVAFDPAGQRVLAFPGYYILGNREDFTARLYEADSGKLQKVLSGHTGTVRAAAFDPAGLRIVTGGEDQLARIWDATSGRALHVLTGHTGAVVSVAFSPDGLRVATGGDDKAIRLWDAATGKLLATLSGHQASIRMASFTADGRWLVTGSGDATAKVWDARSGRLVFTMIGHTEPLTELQFALDGKRLVTSSTDGTLKVWELGRTLFAREFVPEHFGSDAWMSKDGGQLVSGPEEGRLTVWDVHTAAVQRTIKIAELGSPGYFTVSPDGTLAAMSDGNDVRLVRLSDGAVTASLKRHTAGLEALAFSPDGRRLLTTSADGTARIWDPATGAPQLTLEGHVGAVSTGAWSKDGQRVATGTSKGEVIVWNAVTGEKQLGWKASVTHLFPLVFSRDGQRIIVGTTDQKVSIWNAATGALEVSLGGQGAMLSAIDESPDGRLLMSGSVDGRVRIWDAKTWKQLNEFNIGQGLANARFNPAGGSVLTVGAADGWMALWPVDGYAESDQALARFVTCRVPLKLQGEQVIPRTGTDSICEGGASP